MATVGVLAMDRFGAMIVDHIPLDGDAERWRPKVRHVLSNLRALDRAEALMLMDSADPAHVAEHVLGGRSEHALLALLAHKDAPEQPLALFGIIRRSPNVGEAHLVTTQDFPRIAISFARFVRHIVMPRAVIAGYHRVEVRVWDGYPAACRLIELLGASLECVVPMVGKGGETFRQYAWTVPRQIRGG